MFTGIVEGVGKIQKISKNTKNRSAIQMTVNLGKHAKGLKIGQSVALNGVCLTATKITKSNCIFEMIEETTKKTDLGNLNPGDIVNIERSLKTGDRLEGHFVLGHVDGVGIIKKILKRPKEVQVWFEIPKKLSKYVVKKGSIAIDGISLTVVDVKKNLASVCLIPHTMELTNFKTKHIGDKINIETDILGKYILK
ncbi:riboflavin synthase [Candidatus Nitrosarchaeum limnium]|uniref:Riboflavin synthase n=1 Tax=Candidatus Nitrosarchaeum limnium BG20 TaxID=859192 RepID=S2E0L9_9ARCH|nr:riboflavin synthase [Candidatus Nitrosarchaeum limnium]EPA04905.1 riboflavin synthase, alpha subunit [Candidatus Nitrosarchaeum limnium BG20]